MDQSLTCCVQCIGNKSKNLRKDSGSAWLSFHSRAVLEDVFMIGMIAHRCSSVNTNGEICF